ncbi:hypothetical protein AOLI_G00031290 [Acnodon oligacanthus]
MLIKKLALVMSDGSRTEADPGLDPDGCWVRDDAVQMVRLLCFTYSKSASQENKSLTNLSSSFPLYLPSQNTLITSHCSDQHFTENNTASY